MSKYITEAFIYNSIYVLLSEYESKFNFNIQRNTYALCCFQKAEPG